MGASQALDKKPDEEPVVRPRRSGDSHPAGRPRRSGDLHPAGHRRRKLSDTEPDFRTLRVRAEEAFLRTRDTPRNLLSNPCGAEGLLNWELKHGGDGWSVEDNIVYMEGAECQQCFVTSYGWCEKSQIINLLHEGLQKKVLDQHQPQIHISDWYAGRQDCGRIYELEVQLLARNRETVIAEFGATPDPIPQWNHERYRQVSHVFSDYGPGVRYVRFTHRGKATQFWKGFHGVRITNSSVTVDGNPSRQGIFCMDLERLPDEILQLVLSFVSPRELITQCQLVSRKWKQLVDSPTVWRLMCERKGWRDVLWVATRYPDIPWPKVCLKETFQRNLLRNPSGDEGFRHWDVHHGGDGWVVENNRVPMERSESQRCFVTSFWWCQKSQVIDLLEMGLWESLLDHHQPLICISDWYGGREDCGYVYEIHVQLLAGDGETVIKEFMETPDPTPQWNNQRYNQVSHVFQDYGPGVRLVKFTHKGKDTLFWKGFYGARVTNSSVTIQVCRYVYPLL